MRKFLFIVMATLLLAGCANLQNAWQAATAATVSPSLVIVPGNSVDALEASATNYLTLPRCTGQNGPICRSPAATAKLVPAVRSMRVARSNLEQFLDDHPGQLATSGLYDALQASIKTVQDVMAQYHIGAR